MSNQIDSGWLLDDTNKVNLIYVLIDEYNSLVWVNFCPNFSNINLTLLNNYITNFFIKTFTSRFTLEKIVSVLDSVLKHEFKGKVF